MASKVLLVMLMLAATGYCFRLKTKTKRCSTPMDLVLLLESSDELSCKYWRQVRKYAYRLIDQMEDISENGTHVGIITFSTHPEVKIKLNRYTGKQLNAFTIKRDIKKLALQGGDTYIDRALGAASTRMFTEETGMRKGVAKVCIVVTAGVQSDNCGEVVDVAKAAQPLKDKGVKVISVGIGYDMDVMNLIQIASSPDYVWSARNIDMVVNKVLQEAKQAKC